MRLLKINFIACFLILFAASVYSQTGAGVDPAFAPKLETQDAISSLKMRIQPDGKLLVYSRQIPNRISRLNADGSLDTSFNCSACDIFSGNFLNFLDVENFILQPDGKILLAGIISDSNLPKIIRLNADGSLDASFSSSLAPAAGYSGLIVVQDVQADGKIYVTLKQISGNSVSITIYRLNPDGSLDNSFTPIVSNDLFQNETISLKVFPDGQIFIYGRKTLYGSLARLNTDGSKDTSFDTPSLTIAGQPPTFMGYVTDIARQSDGKIVFTGYFTVVNGTAGRDTVARLNADGSVDSGFSTSGLFSPFESFRETTSIEVLPDGKLLVGGSRTIRKVTRLNSNGTIDTTYASLSSIQTLYDLIVDQLGRAYVYGLINGDYKLFRINTDGTIDSNYLPDMNAVGSITALALQNDGKIIVGGNINKVNGVVRNTIVRLNADGTLDASFDTGSGFDSTITEIAVQPSGQIIVAGGFSSVNGTARKRVARLNSNGSLDTSFDPVFNDTSTVVNAIAIQGDGKFILGGEFFINPRNSLARFNADGTLDTSFNPTIVDGSEFFDIIVQSDGKIMVAGNFTGISGVNRKNVARLNADGTVDTSFNCSTSPVNQIIQQPDGKYLIRPVGVILRLNQNGSLDNNFVYPTPQGPINPKFNTISLQPNGAIIVGGNFELINGQRRKNIARLLPSGRLDALYEPKIADQMVITSITQTDGKTIVGGDFTKIGGVIRYGIAKLLQTPAILPPTNFDFDGDGRADISVFRPSDGVWYLNRSTEGLTGIPFGAATDKLVPADYDGDGKTDIAVYRSGTWYMLRSTAGFTGVTFGDGNDIPQPADYDGDGKAEIIVFRPSNGVWYIFNQVTNQYSAVQFGVGTDKPVIADYDGDNKADIAVVRQANGLSTWYILGSTSGFYGVAFGTDADKLVPADYDGDGKIDIAVFRPSNGFWYLNRSTAGFTAFQWGAGDDLPAPADFDGDGKADLTLFRPSNGTWYLQQGTQGNVLIPFGASGDKPTPNAFVY